MYEIVGFLDSMLAVSSYRASLGEYCIPLLTDAEKGEYQLEAEQLYHPLLKSPVKNSIAAHRSVLLTGSNASGKSTFIKTVAINGILAQTLHTVLAESYRGNYFHICSSMALRDDITSSESYYMVEIKSLKRIVDRSEQEGIPVLCFIDEVLRGTNTLERIGASTEILSRLAAANALCFAATHDIELTTLLEKQFDNYHFEEQVEQDDVIFDYRLREGKAVSRNAIKLLQMIGYPPEIVKNAQKRVDTFLERGRWT
jgi:DNA mismatch repair ATPase MutS